MTFLDKLAPNAKVYDAFGAWPEIYGPWLEVCEQTMRAAPSALSPGERELIGAFVSALNACAFCHEVHNSAVREYGLDPGLTRALASDIDSAPVAEKMKPLLKFVRKLTLDHTRMVQADADAVLAAGWSEDDLHLAIAIACSFAFMNRFVHGLGIEEHPKFSLKSGPWLKANGYLARKDKTDKKDDAGKRATG